MKEEKDVIEQRKLTIKKYGLDGEGCDEEGMNCVCDHCGEYAGFSESPEGSVCTICEDWVCDECVDYVKMRELHEEIDEDCSASLCNKCAKDPSALEEYIKMERGKKTKL